MKNHSSSLGHFLPILPFLRSDDFLCLLYVDLASKSYHCKYPFDT